MGKTVLSPRPRPRLRVQTSARAPPQACAVGEELTPDPGTQQESNKLGPQQVFLVTFLHPRRQSSQDGYPSTAPGSMTKSEVLDRLLHVCHSPLYLDAGNISACPAVAVPRLSGDTCGT